MDYPELNFLFGTGLVLVEAISVVLLVLLSRARLPAFAWRAALVYLGLSLVTLLFILSLFLQTMTPAFNLRMLAVLLVAGIGVYALAAFLRRKTLSNLAYRLVFALFILTTFAGFILAYGLFRAMLPV